MALVAGDAVAYHQPNANTSYAQRDGNFLFGIVSDAAGTEVLWSNGTLSTGIDAATCLDKITTAGTTQAGTVVSFGGFSPEYYGIFVRSYQRDLNGGGSAVSFALIRLLSTGQLIEVPLSVVVTVPSR